MVDGPFITDEEASSVFEESPSLELLTPGVKTGEATCLADLKN